MPPPHDNYDNIFETIASRIMRKCYPTNVKHMPPKYANHTEPAFTINPADYSPDLLKKMEDAKIWQDILGHVSPETYTARIILYTNSKRPLPLFCSKNTFRITNLIQELDNKFSSPKIREELINHFCKFKQTYWAFTKLARIWKIKHIPTRIQTDLYMNELDPIDPRTFQLVHPNGIYLFSLQNLARIIVDAITHQSGMFVEPLPVKNPYTNGLLSKCDLVNIYLSLKHNNMRVHEMLEKFFQCEFNIFEFRRKHETELRDLAIEQYSNTASPAELAQDVDDMLRMHKMTKKIKIAQGFPQKNLVETMRPFLQIYLLERFSFSSMRRKYASKQLDLALNQFAEKNPTYGRRITSEFVAPPNSNPFSPTEQYIKPPEKYTTETFPHGSYCKSNYMETHVYNEDTFDRYVETGDSLKTYMNPTPVNRRQTNMIEYESDSEQDEDPIQQTPIYTFSPPSGLIQSRTSDQTNQQTDQQNTLINQINRISNIQLNSAAMYADTPVTVEQIQANTRAILTRIGRLPSASPAPEEDIRNNIYINNNIIHNDLRISSSPTLIRNSTGIIASLRSEERPSRFSSNTRSNIIANEEEDEEEEEEVIQNPEYDSESDTEWANEIMEDGEDSIS